MPFLPFFLGVLWIKSWSKPLVLDYENLSGVVWLWGVTAAPASPVPLISLLSCSFFEIPSHSVQLQQQATQRRKKRRGRIKGKMVQTSRQSSLFPSASSYVPRAVTLCQSSHRWPPSHWTHWRAASYEPLACLPASPPQKKRKKVMIKKRKNHSHSKVNVGRKSHMSSEDETRVNLLYGKCHVCFSGHCQMR